MAIPLISTSRITIVLNLVQVNNDRKNEEKKEKKTCGFHLTRSKWDPYPWIEYVEHGSIADVAGLKTGDCLLQIDQVDIVGLRVKEIALLIKEQSETMVNLQIWRSSDDNNCISSEKQLNGNNNEAGAALSGPLPILIRKFIKAVSTVVSILECPVCLETAVSPISQCVHGHILCAPCRIKTLRCPVCRVRLGQGRCLIADEIQRNIKEAFEDERKTIDNDDNQSNNKSLKKKLFGKISLKSYGTSEIESSNTSTSGRINFTEILQVNHMKKYKTPFSRFLREGFHRAISADNIMAGFENSTKRQDKCHSNNSEYGACKILGELTQADRTKSASMGELCNDKRIMMNGNDTNKLSSSSKSGQHLSVPMTLSSWSGSMESMSNYNLFLCPLFMQSYCREPLSQDRLAEHLGYVHNYKNQMHIYGNRVTISISSSSFESLPIYIFHYADEIFIFQYEKETAWMIGTGVNAMEWILYARTRNKTEFKLQRKVLRINDTIHRQFLSQQAELSNNLSIDLINIQLTPLQSDALL